MLDDKRLTDRLDREAEAFAEQRNRVVNSWVLMLCSAPPDDLQSTGYTLVEPGVQGMHVGLGMLLEPLNVVGYDDDGASALVAEVDAILREFFREQGEVTLSWTLVVSLATPGMAETVCHLRPLGQPGYITRGLLHVARLTYEMNYRTGHQED